MHVKISGDFNKAALKPVTGEKRGSWMVDTHLRELNYIGGKQDAWFLCNVVRDVETGEY